MATVLSAPRVARAPISAASDSAGHRGTAGLGSLQRLDRAAGTVYGWDDLRDRFERLRTSGRDDRVILYRHGATNYNDRNLVSGQHDTALSGDGRRQAEALRSNVPNQLDLIVCSALSRAIETMMLAIPASRRQGKRLYSDARLNEVHLGDLQGRRRRHLPEFEAGDLDYSPPHGESYRQAAERVFSAIADIFAQLADCGPSPRTGVVFCHAGVLRIASTLTSGSNDPKDVFRKTLGNAERLDIGSAVLMVANYWGLGAIDR
jgi:broad specificity phosphatase PhoE